MADVLENINAIVSDAGGSPEGLLRARPVYRELPWPKYWQSDPPFRAVWFTTGYQFDDGGLSIKLGSSRPDEISGIDPARFVTAGGLWIPDTTPLYDAYGDKIKQTNFFVDEATARYVGRNRVREPIAAYFERSGFRRR